MMTTACRPEDGLSRADLRRRRITDAARKLFIRNGFHATGMAQLTKESGVAVGQIYRDFSCKEDIVAALVTADCGRVMMYDALDAAVAAGDSSAVLCWLHAFLDPGDERDGARLFAEIIAESGRNPRIAAIFRELHDRLRGHLRGALMLLVPGAADARCEATVESLLALSVGLFQYGFIAPERDVAPVLRTFNVLVDQQIAALRTEMDA